MNAQRALLGTSCENGAGLFVCSTNHDAAPAGAGTPRGGRERGGPTFLFAAAPSAPSSWRLYVTDATPTSGAQCCPLSEERAKSRSTFLHILNARPHRIAALRALHLCQACAEMPRKSDTRTGLSTGYPKLSRKRPLPARRLQGSPSGLNGCAPRRTEIARAAVVLFRR